MGGCKSVQRDWWKRVVNVKGFGIDANERDPPQSIEWPISSKPPKASWLQGQVVGATKRSLHLFNAPLSQTWILHFSTRGYTLILCWVPQSVLARGSSEVSHWWWGGGAVFLGEACTGAASCTAGAPLVHWGNEQMLVFGRLLSAKLQNRKAKILK